MGYFFIIISIYNCIFYTAFITIDFEPKSDIMKTDKFHLLKEKTEFGKFSNFFIKYLNGSTSYQEAFARASGTYRRLFKKVPYQNYQLFLTEFARSQHNA